MATRWLWTLAGIAETHGRYDGQRLHQTDALRGLSSLLALLAGTLSVSAEAVLGRLALVRLAILAETIVLGRLEDLVCEAKREVCERSRQLW